MERGAYAVVFDADGVLRWGSLRRQLGRLSALNTTSIQDRRSILALPRLVRALSADLDDVQVFYLTAFSSVATRLITTLLLRDGYPSGTLLTTGRRFVPQWLLGGSRARKLARLERLADRMPNVRWVLLGDDGEHDPRLFVDFAHRHPDRVAVIALRQVYDVDRLKLTPSSQARGPAAATVVGAPNAEELLPPVRAALGLGQPTTGSIEDWFLSD